MEREGGLGASALPGVGEDASPGSQKKTSGAWQPEVHAPGLTYRYVCASIAIRCWCARAVRRA